MIKPGDMINHKTFSSKSKITVLNSFYADKYSDSINETFFVRLANLVLHRVLERRNNKTNLSHTDKIRILELGGGNGEHIKYVRQDFSEYVITDLRPNHMKNFNENVTFQRMNAEKIEFQNSSFDRVIVTCLLHHLSDPWECIREINRVLKPNGKADIYVPCDPGVIFRLFRNLFAKGYFRKNDLRKYKELIDALDHQNHCGSIIRLCEFGFEERNLKIEYYPFGIKSWNLNLFFIVRVS